MSTASLMTAPRASASIVPSRDQANAKMRSVVKCVTCVVA
jgi:hypothetical protein